MKIKNKENNKNVIYIQEKDLKIILETEQDIPQSLLSACKKQPLKENPESFILIPNEEIANYLDSRSYIIDYREIKYLTEEEIEQRIDSLNQEKEILEQSPQESHRLTQTTYTIKQLKKYLSARKTSLTIELPLTIDSEELHLAVKEANCLIGLSLNKTKILFRRLDNKPFSDKDTLPIGLVQAAIIEFGPILEIPTEQSGMLEVTAKFTEDGQFFAAEYKYSPLTENQISDRFPMLVQPTRIKRKENQKRKTLLQNFINTKKDVAK